MRTKAQRVSGETADGQAVGQAAHRNCLTAAAHELGRAHTLVRAFTAMFGTADSEPLPEWLDQLETSRLPGLPSLAEVIREDLSAATNE